MMRKTCGNCAWSELQPVLDLGSSPVANTFPATPDTALRRYPLGLLRCMRCDLVQISEVVPDSEIWDADYAFYSSTSPMLRAHHLDYAEWLWATYPDLMKSGTLVEIGCNDGSLLQHLTSPCSAVGQPQRPTVGIDPASGPTEVARDSEWAHRYGAEIITRPFGVAAARDLVDAFGLAAVVVANNVAAHVADLDDFIGGIRTLLDPDGVAIIEVQYLPDLLLGNDVTMVYHEHRYFYRVFTLDDVLRRRGLAITKVWHNDMQGGTLRVEIRPHGTTHPFEAAPWPRAIGDAETWSTRAVADLQGRANRVRDRLRALLDDEARQARTVVGYGASAKAVTLANWLDLSTTDVRAWADTTPAKIGRYLPGTNIPIEQAPGVDTYLLTVVNYLSRVLRTEADWLADDHHRIIVPIPVPRIL